MLDQFLQLVLSAGPIGLVAGLVVLLAVFGFDKSGVIITGDQKRIANLVLSILLAGVPLLSSGLDHSALGAAIASIGSALVYEILKLVIGKLAPAPSEVRRIR